MSTYALQPELGIDQWKTNPGHVGIDVLCVNRMFEWREQQRTPVERCALLHVLIL